MLLELKQRSGSERGCSGGAEQSWGLLGGARRYLGDTCNALGMRGDAGRYWDGLLADTGMVCWLILERSAG